MGLPWLTFTLSAVAVGMIPQAWRFLTYIVALLGLANASLFIFRSLGQGEMDRGRKVGSICVGMLCLTSLAAGWMVGLLADYSYMDEYYRLVHGGAHQSVVASGTGATSYSDASVLRFQEGTFIDTERTLGYMVQGQVYCVAPVTGQTFSDDLMYYAIGENCCEQRSDFHCSKAEPQKGQVLAAVVLNDEGGDDHYQTAIRMLSSVYNMKYTGKRKILKVLSDINAYEGDLWDGALISIICSSILYGLICIMTALFLRNVLKDKPPQSSPF